MCKDGVVLAADNKATMGNLIASKSTQKVFQISDNLVMTIAGSVGDAQALIRIMRAEVQLYEFQEKKVTTRAAATLLANILRNAYKSYMPEWVQLVLGGVDERGPELYSIDIAGGLAREDEYAFTGSGSVIAVGVLEDGYSPDMSAEDGVDLLVRAIRAARERDTYTGGRLMDVAIVKKDGVVWYPKEKIKAKLKAKDKSLGVPE